MWAAKGKYANALPKEPMSAVMPGFDPMTMFHDDLKVSLGRACALRTAGLIIALSVPTRIPHCSSTTSLAVRG